MKLLQWKLLAWGPFTDLLLDLSEGDKGLHLIYGLNEAGKSSALRGLSALLFGVPARSDDGFVHEYTDMRVGAHIRNSAGDELEFVRRKGNKNTLLAPDGSALADDAVLGFLPAGVSQELFEQMFGLNHERLRQGGEELARGGGELGISLFAASMGTGHLKAVMEQLDAQAYELFKPGGSRPVLNTLIREHKELRQAVRNLSLRGPEWEEHVKRREELTHQKQEVSEKVRKLTAEKQRLERIDKALPIISQLKEDQGRLSEFEDIPRLRVEFSQERRTAQGHLERAQREEQKAQDSIKRIKDEIEGLRAPPSILQHADLIAELHQRAGSQKKAMQDLPGLKAQQKACQEACAVILTRIGRDIPVAEARSSCPTVQVRARIRELSESYGKLVAKHDAATKHSSELEEALAETQQSLSDLPAERCADDLKAVVQAARREGDLDRNLKEARSELAESTDQARVGLQRLPLWSGDLAELEELPVPAQETIEKFSDGFTDLAGDEQNLTNRRREWQEQIDAAEREITALREKGDVPTEQDLRQAREKRDSLWGRVRHRVPEEAEPESSAEDLFGAYEEAVGEADSVADRLRLDSERVARLAQHEAIRDQSVGKLEELAQDRKELVLRGDDWQQRWVDAWAEAGLEPLTPKEMTAWRRQYQDLTDRGGTVRRARSRVDELEEKVGAKTSVVREKLAGLGEEAPSEIALAALLEHAEAVADRVAEVERTRASLAKDTQEAEASLKKATRVASALEGEMEEWRAQWAEQVQELGLDQDAEPSQAGAVLDELQELDGQLSRADGLSERIDGIRRDTEAFGRDVQQACCDLGIDQPNDDPVGSAEELQHLANNASKDAASIEQLRKQLAEQEELVDQSCEEIEQESAKLSDLLTEAGCEDTQELPELEQAASRAREVEARIEGARRELSGYCAGGTVEQLMKEAEAVDADALPGQVEDLAQEIADLSQQRDEISQQEGQEAEILKHMDGSAEAAQKAEEAQEKAAAIAKQARHYARLKLASVMLHREIERYRDENQGPVVGRAGELLSVTTGGAYSRLRTDYDAQDQPVLRAVRDNGEVIGLEAMSDGTRDQLFLALRLAFLEKSVRETEPLPFVLDDVLVNFDDERSGCALRALAEISRLTQVIFFTHHQHLCELARGSVSPELLYIHSLGQC